ncbi:MAG: DUF4395 domain-containing protein [Micromonosporaceae bacterium]|nr:DUF4395 domain-containing protein [Micromonosporaceae bacterium]
MGNPARGVAVRGLFSFPNPVNEISARLVATGALLQAVVIIVLDRLGYPGGWWLSVVLAYGFVARVLTGPTLSPLGQLVTRVVTPALNRPAKLVPGPPKRFAQGIGAAVSTTAAVLALAFHEYTAAVIVLAVLAVAATLEAVFAFCVGCTIFQALMRIGAIPEAVCEECNNIWARQRVGQSA